MDKAEEIKKIRLEIETLMKRQLNKSKRQRPTKSVRVSLRRATQVIETCMAVRSLYIRYTMVSSQPNFDHLDNGGVPVKHVEGDLYKRGGEWVVPSRLTQRPKP